jgi:hypothetical protein
MKGCCTQILPGDKVMDRIRIERAVQGQTTALTRDERSMVIWHLHDQRGWGLDLISQHLGFSRSQVSVLLGTARARRDG